MIEVKATREEYEKLIEAISTEGIICYGYGTGVKCIPGMTCTDCLKQRFIILKEEVKDAE